MIDLNNYVVLQCPICGKKTYCLKGDAKSVKEEGCCGKRNLVLIEKERWDYKDIAIIYGNVLEDMNFHSVENLPENLADILSEFLPTQITDGQKRYIILKFMKAVEENI